MRIPTRRLRTLPALLLAVSMTAVAAGPGPAAQAAPTERAISSPAPQFTRLRFGSVMSVSDAGVFVAQARGYFLGQGLEIEALPFQSGPMVVAPLANGDVDVGGGAFSTGLLNAAERGLALAIVADKGTSRPGFEFSQVLPRRELVDRGEVRGVADLRGRRVAAGSTRSGSEALVHRVLRQGGVGIDEVSLVELSNPDSVVALANGAIDASILIEPTLTAAIARGLVTPWDVGRSSTAYGGAYQAGVLMYSGRLVAQPEIAQRFMVAYLQGVRAYNDAFVKGEGRDDVVRILTEGTTVKDPALYDQMQLAGLDPDGRLTRQSLQIEFDYFKDRGYYTGPVTLDNVVDTSFAEYAAQQLGPYR